MYVLRCGTEMIEGMRDSAKRPTVCTPEARPASVACTARVGAVFHQRGKRVLHRRQHAPRPKIFCAARSQAGGTSAITREASPQRGVQEMRQQPRVNARGTRGTRPRDRRNEAGVREVGRVRNERADNCVRMETYDRRGEVRPPSCQEARAEAARNRQKMRVPAPVEARRPL